MVDGRVVLGVLGAIEFLEPAALSVRSVRKRRLLAGLALGLGRDVPSDRLVDLVWNGDPPRTARHALQVYVSELRAQLGDAGVGLVTTTHGYRLHPRWIVTDITLVDSHVGAGRAAALAGRFDEAAQQFQAALDRWRGEPFDGLDEDDDVRTERARLGALRAVMHDELADTYLALGRHTELIPQLQARIVAEPLRERPYEQLMVALYRSGRQSDALDVYTSARLTLAEHVGLDPGRRLAELERAVLMQDAEVLEPAGPSVARATMDAPFVGRRDEMAILTDAWDDVNARGEIGVVVIGGEPGIGKTRLVDEWTGHLDAPVLARGRCPNDTGVPSLWPLGEALRHVRPRPPIDDHHRVTLAPFLRLLGETDGVDVSTRRSTQPESFELHDAVAAFTIEAFRGSGVLVVDDAHWADESTLGVICRLAQRPRICRLLIVMTHRAASVDRSQLFDRALARLVREPGVRTLELGPLTVRDEEAYLARIDDGMTPNDVSRICDRAEGNPLFLVELARLVQGGRDPGSGLPESVRLVLDERFELLGAGADVLSQAAVVGREFDSAVLARVADESADAISAALTVGVRAGVIGSVSATRWKFSHALVADAAAGRLDDHARRGTHLRVAEILDEVPIGDPAVRTFERARHRLAALPLGDPVEAAHACVLAGDELLATFAYEDAAEAFAAAQGALGLVGTNVDLRARALVGEAEALAASGASVRSVGLIEQALPMIDPETQPELLALAVRVLVLHRSTAAALGDDRLDGLIEDAITALGEGGGWLGVQLRTDLAMLHYRTDRTGRSELLAREAVRLAEAEGEPVARAFAATGLHQAIWRPSTVRERLTLATTSIAHARAVGLPWQESMATVFRASDAWELGEFDGVERDLATATELAAIGRRPRFVWMARSWTALLDLYRGEQSAAEAGFAEALAAWGAEPNPDALQCFFAQQLNVRLIADDTSDVIDLLLEVAAADPDPMLWNALLSYPLVLARREPDAHAALDAIMRSGVDRVPDDVTHHVVLAMLSEAAGALDRVDVAAAIMPLLEPFADRRIVTNVYGGGGICWGSVAHQLGVCAATVGERDAARSWFGMASDHHRSDGATPFLDRTERVIETLFA